MFIADETFSQRVESAVTSIETRTDAEIVVVVAHRSGRYHGRGYAAATAATFVLLVLLEAAPFVIATWAVILDLALAWFLFVGLATSARGTRVLQSASRFDINVRRAAESEFYRQGVHATPNRTGLLVYLSQLEQRVEVVTDLGLESHIPRGRFAPALVAMSRMEQESVLTGLRILGDILAEHVPHTAESDAVDLPNAPRIRL